MIENTSQGQTLDMLRQTALCLVKDFIPHMRPGHKYLTETMCGNAFWDPLTKYQRGAVGRFIAWAVVQGDLPLVFADTGKRPTKMYELP